MWRRSTRKQRRPATSTRQLRFESCERRLMLSGDSGGEIIALSDVLQQEVKPIWNGNGYIDVVVSYVGPEGYFEADTSPVVGEYAGVSLDDKAFYHLSFDANGFVANAVVGTTRLIDLSGTNFYSSDSLFAGDLSGFATIKKIDPPIPPLAPIDPNPFSGIFASSLAEAQEDTLLLSLAEALERDNNQLNRFTTEPQVVYRTAKVVIADDPAAATQRPAEKEARSVNVNPALLDGGDVERVWSLDIEPLAARTTAAVDAGGEQAALRGPSEQFSRFSSTAAPAHQTPPVRPAEASFPVSLPTPTTGDSAASSETLRRDNTEQADLVGAAEPLAAHDLAFEEFSDAKSTTTNALIDRRHGIALSVIAILAIRRVRQSDDAVPQAPTKQKPRR